MILNKIFYCLFVLGLVNALSFEANAQALRNNVNNSSKTVPPSAIPGALGQVQRGLPQELTETEIPKEFSTEGITSKDAVGNGITIYLSNMQRHKDEMDIEYCTFDTNIKNEMKNQLVSLQTSLEWNDADKDSGDVYSINFLIEEPLAAGKEITKSHEPVYLWCDILEKELPKITNYDCKMLGLEKKTEKKTNGGEKNIYIPKTDSCENIIKYKKEEKKKETFDDVYQKALETLKESETSN